MPKNSKSNHLTALSMVVLFCFFFSGLAGLIYQVLWLRMIDKVVGSAPFAVATVLSVFMGGLALGSWLAGRYIDRISSKRNLLSLYGKAELAIGIYGLLLPFFIYAAKPVYSIAYNSLFLHFWLYRFFTFFGCSLLLIVPTTLMGITLPVLCRFYVEDLGHIGARTGRLYGINTIGAAAGVVICGFVLIAQFGVWGSIFTAAGINIIVGVLCIGLAGRDRPLVLEPIKKSKGEGKPKTPTSPGIAGIDDRIEIQLALWIFGISGFCAMAYEVFWTRLLGLTIGPTTYSFTLVVSTFIVGLALGNILFGWLADRVKGPFQLLVITQVCAACLALVVSQFLGNSQFFFSKLIDNFQDDFGERILVQSVVLFFVLVGPTVFLGATFPLVNRIYARSLPDIGRSIGTAYAVNTIGAILGSFVAGFILIPLLGKENGLRMTAGLQLLISVPALAYLSFRTGERIRASLTGLISLSIGLILIINFPSWDHKTLSRGWYYRPDSIAQYFGTTSWFEAIWEGTSKIAEQEANTDVVFYGDGIGGFTTVRKWISPTGTANYYLVNSGKTDASSHSDRLTQALSAHVPLLFHPNPEKVMILGLASGMTAGEALLYPVRQLDLLEINDQVIKAAEFFTPWNNGCLTDPKSRIIVQDGRNHLELTDEKYDVIISEPSNPWMAGLANLFTLDYFKTVKGRLNGNGIFIQWTNAYDMDWNSFSMIGRNFAEVFPNGLLIKTIGTSDFLLVGFADKKDLDLKTADKNIVYAKKSKNITIRDPRVIFNLIVTEDLKEFFGSGLLHTDNRPHLEFAAPKNIGMNIETVQERIQHNSRLSEETKEIVELNNNIDRLLDILNLMIVGPSPPFRVVDLKNVTPTQQKRYQDILQDYCGNEDVADYGIFPNSDLKKECACLQVVKIREHLALNPEDRYAYYQLGLGLRAMGDADEAIDAFRQAVSLYPSYDAAYIEMGETLTSQGKFAEALDLLFEALRNSPDSAEVHNNIGNALAQLGKLSEAIDHYHKALQINPKFVDAYNNLGILYAGQGRHDDALTHYKKGLEIDPDNADCNVNTGILLVQMGQISDSIDYFLEALKIDPNHFLAHYNIGIVLLNQGQIEEAADYFLKASEVNPDNPDVHRILGVILEKLGRFKEAVSHFSEALKLDPYSAETHDNLGVTLAQMGQLVEAVEHFKKALEIDSSFESAREHLEVAQREIDK